MPSHLPRSLLITPSPPSPTAPDPYAQSRVSTSLQQTADRSKPPSRNIAPRTQSSLSHLLPKQRHLYQTPSAPPTEHLHRCFPIRSWSWMTMSYRARAESSLSRAISSSCPRFAVHLDNPPAGHELNIAPVANQ